MISDRVTTFMSDVARHHPLGFSQARTTIPKWGQRGAKNPLDKILSLILSRRIAAQRTKESQTANDTSTSSGVVVASSGLTTGNAADLTVTKILFYYFLEDLSVNFFLNKRITNYEST